MRWTFDTMPEEFWRRIDAAAGDPHAFETMLQHVARGDVEELYWQYLDLAEQLVTDQRIPSRGDGSVIALSWWIVAQGRDYCARVMHGDQVVPATAPPGGDLLSVIGLVYRTRFGAAIPSR